MKTRPALLLAGCLAAAGALAQPQAPSVPAVAALRSKPGAAVPLETALRNHRGQAVRLADYFHPGQPVLLVLGYYRCPQLCGLVMHGLLEALHGSGLARGDWRIVGVSIDPRDAPADAARRLGRDLAYARFLEGAQPRPDAPRLDLLVANAQDSRRIADAVGFRYGAAPSAADEGGLVHPASVVLLTPHGTVSRYFDGVQFEAREMRRALVEAADGRIGGIGDRLALLCGHFVAAAGRHNEAVRQAARVVAVLSIAGLALLVWRQARRGGR